MPTHADNLSAVMCHTISIYEPQLLQIGKYIYSDDLFLLNANSQMFKLKSGLTTLFLLPSCVELKGQAKINNNNPTPSC